MATTTKTDDVTIEALTAERDRLVTQQGQTQPGSVEYFETQAALAQVEAELARREIPDLEQKHAAAEARVAAMRPKVAELSAAYTAAKQAAEDGPGTAFREAKYDLDLAIERAGYADGNRGELAKARFRLAEAARAYQRAIEGREVAEQRQQMQEIARLEAQAERDRRDAKDRERRSPTLPEVPAPDLARLVTAR